MNIFHKDKNFIKLLDKTKPYFADPNYINIKNYNLDDSEILIMKPYMEYNIIKDNTTIDEKTIKWTNTDGLTDLAELRAPHGLLTKSDIYVLLNILLLESDFCISKKIFHSSKLLSIMGLDDKKIYHLKIKLAIEKIYFLKFYINTHEYVTIEDIKLLAEKKSGFGLITYRQILRNNNSTYNIEINFNEEFIKDMLLIINLLLKTEI